VTTNDETIKTATVQNTKQSVFMHQTMQCKLTDLLNFIYGVNGFFGGMTVVSGNLVVTVARRSPSGTDGKDMEILVMSGVEPLCWRDG